MKKWNRWTTEKSCGHIPLACAECDNSLSSSESSSIPLCYTSIPFPSTLFHQLVFHPPSLHLSVYFLVYLSALLFPNSFIIPFWEFYFLPFTVHAQTSISKGRWQSEVVVKASHIREITLNKSSGPLVWRFYDGLTPHLSKRIHGYEFLKRALEEGDKWWWNINLLKTKHNLLYIRNQSVPRCKHFSPQL
jgi:hypothetical protein